MTSLCPRKPDGFTVPPSGVSRAISGIASPTSAPTSENSLTFPAPVLHHTLPPRRLRPAAAPGHTRASELLGFPASKPAPVPARCPAAAVPDREQGQAPGGK